MATKTQDAKAVSRKAGIVAASAGGLSFLTANVAAAIAGPMALWYGLVSIGSGLMAAVMAIVTVIHAMGWDD
jgi:hypothetical protein